MKLPVNTLTLSPAAILYGLNTGVVLLVAFGLPLSAGMVGAISTIAGGVVTIAMAVLARPWHAAAIPAALTTILTALAAFHFNLGADRIGALVAFVSVVLGWLSGSLVIPTAAHQRGTTAHALMLAGRGGTVAP